MSGFLYALVGWGAAFASWMLEPAQPDPRKRRADEARRQMARELYGKPRLVQGGKK